MYYTLLTMDGGEKQLEDTVNVFFVVDYGIHKHSLMKEIKKNSNNDGDNERKQFYFGYEANANYPNLMWIVSCACEHRYSRE